MQERANMSWCKKWFQGVMNVMFLKCKGVSKIETVRQVSHESVANSCLNRETMSHLSTIFV